jgi:hypothetical protein
MRSMMFVILSMALLIGHLYGQTPQSTPGKLYAVVFGFVVDEGGKLKSFRVSKVIDPESGSTDAVDLRVPDSYLSAARAQLMKKTLKPTVEGGKPKEMFTYFFFDPKQPTRADIDPKAGNR